MSNQKKTLDPVELHPAFVWDCPECGTEHFERAVVPEMSDEERRELQDEHGVQPWDEGDFLMMPMKVACPRCGRAFDTVPM